MIAEKFEALVAVGAIPRGLVQRRDMGERGRQQCGIGKFMPDARLDRGGRLPGGGLAALLLRGHHFAAGVRLGTGFARRRYGLDVRRFVVHRTMENMRFHRTAVGQRQNIQACSPSAMEKKIIWARPIRFSNGT